MKSEYLFREPRPLTKGSYTKDNVRPINQLISVDHLQDLGRCAMEESLLSGAGRPHPALKPPHWTLTGYTQRVLVSVRAAVTSTIDQGLKQ